MSVSILVLLALLTLAGALSRYYRLSRILMAVAVVFILVIGNGVFAQLVIESLQTHPRATVTDWKERNAFIILGAGTSFWSASHLVVSAMPTFSRAHEAIRLYLQCKKQNKKCHIYVTGGDPAKNGTSEAEALANALTEMGVAETDIFKEMKSKNTYQNAKFTATMMAAQEPYDEVFLVTSGLHMKRSLVYFSHFKIFPTPAPADQASALFKIIPLSHNLSLFDLGIHEYLGMVRFHLYNFMGWNK